MTTTSAAQSIEAVNGCRTRLTRLENARTHLRGMRPLVKEGGAPQTYKKYQSLLKSLDGAIRHAETRVERSSR